MIYPERSSYILTLAEEAGIPLGPGEQEVLGDEVFFRFREHYQAWSKTRDKALEEHLMRTPNLFRCYLPYSSRVFHVAYQILWYLDEIVVKDPIEQWVDLPDSKSLENAKKNLCSTLQVLNNFRQSIDSGYLLLAGSILIPKLTGGSDQVQNILVNPEVVLELDRAVSFGVDRRLDDQGKEWIVYNAFLDSGGIYGWHVEKLIGTVTSPGIKVGEVFPRVSASDISAILKKDIYDDVRNLYPREVHRTLHAVSVATSINAAVLFDRQVDPYIISIAGGASLDQKKQALAIGSFNLALPYLHQVPANRLLELRTKIPSSFYEFRSHLSDIVFRAMKEDPENTHEVAQLLADRELSPLVAKLQSEMEAAAKKARILGYGLPVVSVVGALSGACVGAGIVPVILMFMAGAHGAIKAAADFSAEKKKAQINPFYFLWRAKPR